MPVETMLTDSVALYYDKVLLKHIEHSLDDFYWEQHDFDLISKRIASGEITILEEVMDQAQFLRPFNICELIEQYHEKKGEFYNGDMAR